MLSHRNKRAAYNKLHIKETSCFENQSVLYGHYDNTEIKSDKPHETHFS